MGKHNENEAIFIYSFHCTILALFVVTLYNFNITLIHKDIDLRKKEIKLQIKSKFYTKNRHLQIANMEYWFTLFDFEQIEDFYRINYQQLIND